MLHLASVRHPGTGQLHPHPQQRSGHPETGEYLRFITTLQDGDELQVYRENGELRVERVIDGKGYDVLSLLDGSSTLWTVYHGAQAWQRTADSGDGWLFLSLTMHAAFTTIITEGSNG